MSGPIRWPSPPAPPTRPPKPVLPPTPVIPPGTPPAPIGDVTVTPVVPQPPKDTAPPQQYQPGYWSDGWAVVRQHEGRLVLDASTGLRVSWPIQTAGASAADILNQALGVIGLAARATTVEPWPPARTGAAQKTTGEALMSTEMSVSEKLDILIAVAEQTAKDVAELKTPAGVEADSGDHWAAAYALTEEPSGLDVPMDVFTPEKAALYGVFHRSVINGSRIYPDPRRVKLAKALALGTDIDGRGQVYLDLLVKWAVDRDVAIFALLAGLVDPYETGFTARLERDVAMLAGTYKPETLSDGTVINRFVRLDFEGAYKLLLPSGSGGQAGQGGNG